jgi:class 3 adenylate cyclase
MTSDFRAILPAIRVPTLVLYRRPHTVPMEMTSAQVRYVAEHIDGARLVEVPGTDSLAYLGDAESVAQEIEEFLTGARSERPVDRVLATVLFTDLVASTEHASRMGDRAWRERLDAHDAMVRSLLQRFRGQEIKQTGDGFLATFDGPARAINCGVAITGAARQLGMDVRAGLHTGEIELRGGDIGGVAVHIGARVAGHAGAGEVLVSRTVVDLVAGSGLTFDDRGEHALKGVEGSWRLFAVRDLR